MTIDILVSERDVSAVLVATFGYRRVPMFRQQSVSPGEYAYVRPGLKLGIEREAMRTTTRTRRPLLMVPQASFSKECCSDASKPEPRQFSGASRA